MAKFSDILKAGAQGFGKYMTQEGRDLAQMVKLIQMGSKVKRVRPEDFKNPAEYKRALVESQGAHEALGQEQINPTANAALNGILGVTPEEQERQKASNLLTAGTGLKNVALTTSKVLPGASSLLGALGIGAAGGALTGVGMSKKGEEVESTLLGGLLGTATGGVTYGANKALSAIGKSLLNKVNTKTPSLAGKKATLDWGLKAKDIETLDGWNESQKWATEAYSDAAKLKLPTRTRYQKADALQKITEALDNDSNVLINEFDKAGTPAASANELISKLQASPSLSYARTKDPQTFEWAMQTISNQADESGNLSMRAIKDIIKTVQDASGGFENATDQSSAAAKQIFTATRSIVRDVIDNVAPELSSVLSKWSKYIKVNPSVISQVTKQTGPYIPVMGKLPTGTLGTEAGDILSSLTSGRGGQGMVSGPNVIQKLLGNVSLGAARVGQSVAPIQNAIGGAIGSGSIQIPQSQPEPAQLGDDDEGLMLIRSAFEQPQPPTESGGMGGGQDEQIKQALVVGILSGEISASDAEAVMMLLGMNEPKVDEPSANQSKAMALQTSLNTLKGVWDSTSGIGKLSETLGINIGAGTRSLDQAKAAVVEDLGRLQSQGVVSPTERAEFERMMPNSWDNPQLVQQKLQAIQDRINSY